MVSIGNKRFFLMTLVINQEEANGIKNKDIEVKLSSIQAVNS